MTEEKRKRGRPKLNPDAPGSVTPRQFRLAETTLAELDAIGTVHALQSRSDVIRFLARKETNDLKRKGLI